MKASECQARLGRNALVSEGCNVAERLRLRPHNADDAEWLHELYSPSGVEEVSYEFDSLISVTLLGGIYAAFMAREPCRGAVGTRFHWLRRGCMPCRVHGHRPPPAQ